MTPNVATDNKHYRTTKSATPMTIANIEDEEVKKDWML